MIIGMYDLRSFITNMHLWEFLQAGGPIMFFLVLASIVGVTFIIERGLALRWNKVIPPRVENALDTSRTAQDLPRLVEVCRDEPSPLSRLLLTAEENLRFPKADNADTVQTKARHEITKLERGLVILEIVVGIGPLLGLVGTISGLIRLFAELGKSGMADNSALASGIAVALNTTLMGLLVAIPSLIAWSYYTKKVEVLAIEMETLCEKFLRMHYRDRDSKKG
ncbi:MAG: tolQ [Verrucomicrobiales bacterium]|nr:tolQ [Verrucomicrobiales bacterium]